MSNPHSQWNPVEYVRDILSKPTPNPWACPHKKCFYPGTCRDLGKCAAVALNKPPSTTVKR